MPSCIIKWWFHGVSHGVPGNPQWYQGPSKPCLSEKLWVPFRNVWCFFPSQSWQELVMFFVQPRVLTNKCASQIGSSLQVRERNQNTCLKFHNLKATKNIYQESDTNNYTIHESCGNNKKLVFSRGHNYWPLRNHLTNQEKGITWIPKSLIKYYIKSNQLSHWPNTHFI